jgi:predicted metal-dependent hydrolase
MSDERYTTPPLPFVGTETTPPPDSVRREVPGHPPVEIRTSRRRRKTAVAFWEEGTIVVVLPGHLKGRARDDMVDWLVDRTRARRPGAGASDEALTRRARALADRYVDGVRPASVRWVTNQSKRWGSCTAATGEIRLSHRLQHVPDWVLDAVLVHELAHLVHTDHSPRFHAVANRHPRQADAGIFLDGFAHGLETRG